MPREFVVTVETADGIRYVGQDFGIVRAKSDATVYGDIGSAMKRQNQLTTIWPGKSFGIEAAATELAAFKKENSGLL